MSQTIQQTVLKRLPTQEFRKELPAGLYLYTPSIHRAQIQKLVAETARVPVEAVTVEEVGALPQTDVFRIGQQEQLRIEHDPEIVIVPTSNIFEQAPAVFEQIRKSIRITSMTTLRGLVKSLRENIVTTSTGLLGILGVVVMFALIPTPTIEIPVNPASVQYYVLIVAVLATITLVLELAILVRKLY